MFDFPEETAEQPQYEYYHGHLPAPNQGVKRGQGAQWYQASTSSHKTPAGFQPLQQLKPMWWSSIHHSLHSHAVSYVTKQTFMLE